MLFGKTKEMTKKASPNGCQLEWRSVEENERKDRSFLVVVVVVVVVVDDGREM